MVFSNLTFIFAFLPIFFILYFIVPKKIKNFIILIFSLIFYAWGEIKYIPLLIFSSVVDYLNGLFIYKYKDSNKKKIFLLLSIIINVGVLFIFKYSNFIISNINSIFNINIPNGNIPLPLGISFFTFQTMSYSIDVYRGKFNPEKNFINFMTYVTMFPQLVAGPIVKYDEIKDELHNKKLSLNNVSEGLFIFVIGLIKKVLLANNLGYIYTILFSDITNASLLSSWLCLLCFTLQIYFDFSGYSDMASGLGKILGFNYPKNFNYPYITQSITDFWRRWHMTLSSWFKDYVYIPLGGNRCSKVKNTRNILIVWLLTGIWHGASWNFLFWGLYFGIILILEKTILKRILDKIPTFIKHIYAIFLIMIGWAIFSVNNMSEFTLFIQKLFINKNIIDNNFIFYLREYYIFIVFGIIFSTPIIKLKLFKNKCFMLLGYIITFILFIICISYLISDSYNPFLYFRF